jgi:two-component system, NtrC family, response regulator AtoC
LAETGLKMPADSANPSFVAGMSPAMQTLEAVIAEIAPTNIPVLFLGEIGTGKAMYADHLHRLSRRCGEPLLRISCPSVIPATFLTDLGLNLNRNDEETKSAAGTVFFNHVDELDPVCQRALLYALPDGNPGPRRGLLAARVVSASSRNLDEEMRVGRFRSELYYRINAVCLRLPPLRERKEDIPLLVESLLTKHAVELGRPRPSLSPRTLRMFLDHSWSGNIRELENVVKKIVALGDEQLAIADFGVPQPEPQTMKAAATRGYSLKAVGRAASREAERELILKVLGQTRWNRKRAAQELQISYKSLLYKLKQIGFEGSGAD